MILNIRIGLIVVASLFAVATAASRSFSGSADRDKDDWPAYVPVPSRSGYFSSVGNHRFYLKVGAKKNSDVAVGAQNFTVHVPWRRSDTDPLSKAVYVRATSSGTSLAGQVKDCAYSGNAEAINVTFSVIAGAASETTEYYLYYMPFTTCEYQGGSCTYDARSVYDNASLGCKFIGEENNWKRRLSPGSSATYEARAPFESFEPMEMPMTALEQSEFMKARNVNKDGVVLVGETHDFPIKMKSQLPFRWLGKPASPQVHATAAPDQHLTFQIAAINFGASNVTVASIAFSGLESSRGDKIPSSSLRCMNANGVDFWGRPTTYEIPEIEPGNVLALWIALAVPETAAQGSYSGKAAVSYSVNGSSSMMQSVDIRINISGSKIEKHGDDDIALGSRLHWFDSTLGIPGDTVPAPFTPLKIDAASMTFGLLGKEIRLRSDGLPSSVAVIEESGLRRETLLAPGMTVSVGGKALRVISNATIAGTPTKMSTRWIAQSASSDIKMTVMGSIDCTGYNLLNISLEALANTSGAEFNLTMPSSISTFAMGLGRSGGTMTRWMAGSESHAWRWDGKNGHNGLWVGSTKAGLRLELKGDDPLWYAGSPYDSGSAPPAPASWSNGGIGGIQLHKNGTVVAFTGKRSLAKGDVVTLTLSLMVTPLRPPDQHFRFKERWAQLSGPHNYTMLSETGVSNVNMHQGNAVNPWINYPFLTNEAMKQAADACHDLGMNFNVYNTMRELSNRCSEYFAMLSWGGTLVPGDGGGADWLQEHIRSGYLPAWSNPVHLADHKLFPGVPNPDPSEGARIQDVGMRVVALSRWNNYYIEGIGQIQRDYGANGIYLDEIAYDRTTMLRARKVLGSKGRIDHHADCGFVSSSPALNYMELMPFIDRLWYGEGFDYNINASDYWLIEISGFATGLSADMLRYTTMHHDFGMTRYHYRGLLFGSAFRYSSTAVFDPSNLWKLWDAFGIEDAEMVGWWEYLEDSTAVTLPVSATNDDFKVTTYLKSGKAALVCIAAWGAAAETDVPTELRLIYNWDRLQINESHATISLPSIPPFQVKDAKRPYVGATVLRNEASSFNITATQGGLVVLIRANI